MQGELQAALEKLWDDARPRLLARVEVLDAAVAAPDRADLRERARIEAHTLTGTLGTFGRVDLSNTARAAETALLAGEEAELRRAAAELRAALA